MALRFALMKLRAGRGAGAATSSRRGRASGGSCGGPHTLPSCPPCAPAPAPACRAPPPTGPCALRVVCCPPPAGARPPCPPRVPACPLTCEHAARAAPTPTCDAKQYKLEGVDSVLQSEMGQTRDGCSLKQDGVALRLTLAKRARRADYEYEVADRANSRICRQSPTSEPYRLGDERECAPATDGRQYVVPRCDDKCARCGPDRTPPPPRRVRLAPDDKCRIRTEARLDPCAHRPRIMVEIDRSAPSPPTSAPADSSAPCPDFRQGGSPPRGIASRLMSGLKLSRGPKEQKSEKKTVGGSRCAGDSGWCANPPRPSSAPARCRRLTAAERLRGRTAKPECDKRRLHTSATNQAADSESVAHSKPVGGLVEVVRERSQFGEAGRGRVVSDTCCGGKGSTSAAGGGLELRVPTGVERVRVRVSLENATSAARAPARDCAASRLQRAADISHVDRNRCIASATPPEKDSWMSLKNIQKKLAGCRKTPESPSSKDTKKPSAAPSPGLPSTTCRSPSPSVSPQPICPPKKTPRCPSHKPQPVTRSPCPPKKPDSGCRNVPPSSPTPPSSAPAGPTRCGQGETQKTRGPTRFSPTLGLIFSTIVSK